MLQHYFTFIEVKPKIQLSKHTLVKRDKVHAKITTNLFAKNNEYKHTIKRHTYFYEKTFYFNRILKKLDTPK